MLTYFRCQMKLTAVKEKFTDEQVYASFANVTADFPIKEHRIEEICKHVTEHNL